MKKKKMERMKKKKAPKSRLSGTSTSKLSGHRDCSMSRVMLSRKMRRKEKSLPRIMIVAVFKVLERFLFVFHC
jgi:hypothetical protein